MLLNRDSEKENSEVTAVRWFTGKKNNRTCPDTVMTCQSKYTFEGGGDCDVNL